MGIKKTYFTSQGCLKNHGQVMLVTCCDRVRNVQAFPGGSDGKESVRNVGDSDLVPGLGRPPGEGNGHPLQYSCLDNTAVFIPG